MLQQVLGKKTTVLDEHWLQAQISTYDRVILDIGTGDGRYVLDSARCYPNHLVIGIDPVAKNMAASAHSALRKEKKGGLANVIFLQGSAEQLPGPLIASVDYIAINYPWNALLRIVAEPDIDVLRCVRKTCKINAQLAILLNYTVLEDRAYLERLGLGRIGDLASDKTLFDNYSAAGFTVLKRHIISGDPPVRTRWGRQLVRGSSRKTLIIEATAADQPQSDN